MSKMGCEVTYLNISEHFLCEFLRLIGSTVSAYWKGLQLSSSTYISTGNSTKGSTLKQKTQPEMQSPVTNQRLLGTNGD
jgi:hypothetical protein